MAHLTLDSGVRIYCEAEGPEGGTPVLFIHGGAGGPVRKIFGTPKLLDGVFGDDILLIRYDRRNSGRSSSVRDAFTIDDLAVEAFDVLDAVGINRAIIIGSSAGGPIAIACALAHPERVMALGLLNTGASISAVNPKGFAEPLPRGIQARVDVVKKNMALSEDVRIRGAADVFTDHMEEVYRYLRGVAQRRRQRFGEDPRELEQLLDQTPVGDVQEMWLDEILNRRAYFGVDYTDRLSELTMPTLILHGDADDVIDLEYAVAMRNRIPHATYRVVAGAGHGVPDHPEGKAIIREWVEGVR